MSGRVERKGKHIAHTIAFLLRGPGSLMPKAMWVCKYLTNKSINPAKQMVCQWYMNKNNNQPTMVADSGRAAGNGGPSEGGEGRGARQQTSGWGGLCNEYYPNDEDSGATRQ